MLISIVSHHLNLLVLDIFFCNFHFRPCVYLAYFRSYGHLKIVKCIGMYQKNHFLNGQNSLENISISLKLSWQMLL